MYGYDLLLSNRELLRFCAEFGLNGSNSYEQSAVLFGLERAQTVGVAAYPLRTSFELVPGYSPRRSGSSLLYKRLPNRQDRSVWKIKMLPPASAAA